MIHEIQAKSIFVKSNLPDADFVANSYTGCLFGCSYCYATFMGQYVNEELKNWGKYVYVKINAIELARKELSRWNNKKRQSKIFLSSVTDAYHGVERKYRLTRGILEALAENQYPGPISILTKGPLVLRDIDVFKELNDVEVGMTVTTVSDPIGRMLEVHAPQCARRIQALGELNVNGVSTYAFVGPLLPHLRYMPDELDKLFGSIKDAGVSSLYVEHINLKPYIRERLFKALEHERPELRAVYSQAVRDLHIDALNEIVMDCLKRYGLTLKCGEIFTH